MSWIEQLAVDLPEEFGDRPRVVTLATIAGDRPDARSVVVREFSEDGAIVFTSDARSEKNAQLRANPFATIVIWLTKKRRQYRIDGHVELVDRADPRREKQWTESSDDSRAMFFWPAPGAVFDEVIVPPLSVEAGTPMPESFEVLVLHPLQVQVLDLQPRPHHRFRWVLDQGKWSAARINP